MSTCYPSHSLLVQFLSGMSTCYPRHWLLVQVAWVLVTPATGSWFLAMGHISTFHRCLELLATRPYHLSESEYVRIAAVWPYRDKVIGARCRRMWQMDFTGWIPEVGFRCFGSSPAGWNLWVPRTLPIGRSTISKKFHRCYKLLHLEMVNTSQSGYIKWYESCQIWKV